jgi:hypothetical protein
MRPVMLPVVCCATAGVAASQSEQRTIIEEMIFFMPDCLRKLRNSVKRVPIRGAQRAPTLLSNNRTS